MTYRRWFCFAMLLSPALVAREIGNEKLVWAH